MIRSPRSWRIERGPSGWIALGLVAFAALFFGGCGQEQAAEKTAIQFLEYTVFTRDDDRAAALAEDAALAKVESGQERARFAIPDPGRGVRNPVARELIDQRSAGDGSITFTFRIILRPKSGGSQTGTVTIRVGRRGSRWRVLDYEMKVPDYGAAAVSRQ